jgi:hypothetical protein
MIPADAEKGSVERELEAQHEWYALEARPRPFVLPLAMLDAILESGFFFCRFLLNSVRVRNRQNGLSCGKPEA